MAMHFEPRACPTSCVPGLDAAPPILGAAARLVVGSDLDTTILCWNPLPADLCGFRAIEAPSQPIDTLLPKRLMPRNSSIDFNSHNETLAGAFPLADR
jgi:hypothetical protein